MSHPFAVRHVDVRMLFSALSMAVALVVALLHPSTAVTAETAVTVAPLYSTFLVAFLRTAIRYAYS